MANGIKRKWGKCIAQIRLDRGTKYILALSQVQKVNDENHYVMFVDADDFIHKKLTEYINNSDVDLLKISKGFRLVNKIHFVIYEILRLYVVVMVI